MMKYFNKWNRMAHNKRVAMSPLLLLINSNLTVKNICPCWALNLGRLSDKQRH